MPFKGITALGNQLTKEKVNQINLLDSLPYEAPEEVPAQDIVVVDEDDVSDAKTNKDIDQNDDDQLDENGQVKLF